MRIMNFGLRRLVEWRHAGAMIQALWVLATAALAAGCAHSGKDKYGAGSLTPIPTPQPPAFLDGPMALLLTNVDGFRAHVVLERGTPARQVAAGELMGKGGKLLFAPALDPKARKQATASAYAFIWSVSGNRGYMLNDPLQAYAPCLSSIQFTNVIAGAATPAAPEKIAGHRCLPSEAVVAGDDGSAAAFRVWRAEDLKGLPLRIVGTSSGLPATLTLSKVRLERLPDDLFLPPNGFAKYDSSEALLNELAARQQGLRRRPTYRTEGIEPGMTTSPFTPSTPR